MYQLFSAFDQLRCSGPSCCRASQLCRSAWPILFKAMISFCYHPLWSENSNSMSLHSPNCLRNLSQDGWILGTSSTLKKFRNACYLVAVSPGSPQGAINMSKLLTKSCCVVRLWNLFIASVRVATRIRHCCRQVWHASRQVCVLFGLAVVA